MQQISYSGDTFVTSDDIATKVLEYARALGMAGSDDTIEIPAVDESGAVWKVQLLIGPASELVARQVEGKDQDLHSAELLAELDRRITAFQAGTHAAVTPDPDVPQNFDPEWDELG